MSTAALPDGYVPDQQLQRNFAALLAAINDIGQFIYHGTGAPTSTPPGAALYFREDPSPGAAVYGYDGTSWTAIV